MERRRGPWWCTGVPAPALQLLPGCIGGRVAKAQCRISMSYRPSEGPGGPVEDVLLMSGDGRRMLKGTGLVRKAERRYGIVDHDGSGVTAILEEFGRGRVVRNDAGRRLVKDTAMMLKADRCYGVVDGAGTTRFLDGVHPRPCRRRARASPTPTARTSSPAGSR